MKRINAIIRHLCILVIALGVAFAGLGMTAAHAGAFMPGHDSLDHFENAHTDHETHSAMSHDGHDKSRDGNDPHNGHSSCTLTICCHVGGEAYASPLSKVDLVEVVFAAPNAHQYAEADKDRADKPPKHT